MAKQVIVFSYFDINLIVITIWKETAILFETILHYPIIIKFS